MTEKNRRTTLTPLVHKTIVDAVRAGGYFDDSCRFAGTPPSTAYGWMQKALKPGADPQYKRFLADIDHARAAARLERVVVIRNAGQQGDWKAAAWYLERTEPGKWGQTTRVTVKGDADQPLQVVVSAETLDNARAIRDQLALLGLGASDDPPNPS